MLTRVCLLLIVVSSVYPWGRSPGSNYRPHNRHENLERKCSARGQICFDDRNCCQGLACETTNNYRGRLSYGSCTDPKPQSASQILETSDTGTKGRGEKCDDSSECSNTYYRLCCQTVRFFRAGSSRICDKVTGLSTCL